MKMKSILCLLTITCCLLLTGCRVGNVPVSQGLPDQSYLFFVSTQKFKEPVQVTLDKKTVFEAIVVRERKATVKGRTYAVSTGKHHVSVSFRGKVIWEREVFLSTQETKKITLP